MGRVILCSKPVEPAIKEVNISFQGANDARVDRTEQIRAAFLDLAAKCPAAPNAVSIVVQYEHGIGTQWRGEKLGWKSDLYFNAADVSGEHHHFYVRQDGRKRDGDLCQTGQPGLVRYRRNDEGLSSCHAIAALGALIGGYDLNTQPCWVLFYPGGSGHEQSRRADRDVW